MKSAGVAGADEVLKGVHACRRNFPSFLKICTRAEEIFRRLKRSAFLHKRFSAVLLDSYACTKNFSVPLFDRLRTRRILSLPDYTLRSRARALGFQLVPIPEAVS